jgi:hypothetical protein
VLARPIALHTNAGRDSDLHVCRPASHRNLRYVYDVFTVHLRIYTICTGTVSYLRGRTVCVCLCAVLKGQQPEISLLEFLIIYGTVRYPTVPGTQYGAQISRLKGFKFFFARSRSYSNFSRIRGCSLPRLLKYPL